MTGSSGVVLSNLAYLIGAVVLAIIGGFAVWLHHRQPKSIDANVDAFQRGLQAIAPDSSRPGSSRTPTVAPVEPLRVRPRSPAAPQTNRGGAHVQESDRVDLTEDHTEQPAGTGDGAGDRAGAETG